MQFKRWGQPDPAPTAPTAPPEKEVEEVLAEIEALRLRVNDIRLRGKISRACMDTVKFLGLIEEQTPDKLDGFRKECRRNLESVRDVIRGFIQVEGDRDRSDRLLLMQQSREAIAGYADNIHTNIGRVGQADLIAFRANTQLLSALRFK